MNKLLQKQAMLLTQAFDDFGTFDFNKELASRMVAKHEKEIEAVGDFGKFLGTNNDNVKSLLRESMVISALEPFFERENGKLILKSKRFFELSRFAIAISAFVKGVDQYVSAEKISKLKQYQFTVFAYYSSIFQLLTSYLAIHGIVYIPKSSEGWSIEELQSTKEGNRVNKVMKLVPIGYEKFTKGIYNQSSNQWTFYNIGNDHTTRWKEFCDLLKLYLRKNWDNQIPNGVERFWGYIKVQAEYNQKYWDKNVKEYKIEFANKKEFINTLNAYKFYPSRIRHQKIYENRHFDLFAWAYCSEDRPLPEDLKSSESDFFGLFAKDMVLWQYRNLKELFDTVHLNCKDETSYFKGMNEIADTPELRIIKYLKNTLSSEKILIDLGRDVPEFINMLFV